MTATKLYGETIAETLAGEVRFRGSPCVGNLKNTHMCTCYEHTIHHTICKHIHALQMAGAMEKQGGTPVDSRGQEESKTIWAQSLLDSIGKTQTSTSITHSAVVLAWVDTIKEYCERSFNTDFLSGHSRHCFQALYQHCLTHATLAVIIASLVSCNHYRHRCWCRWLLGQERRNKRCPASAPLSSEVVELPLSPVLCR